MEVIAHDACVEIKNQAGRLLVDASALTLVADSKTRGVWELGATRAGVNAVVELVRDELRIGRLGADDARMIREAVVGALRRSAHRAGVRDAPTERQVEVMRSTALLYSAPYIAAKFLRADAGQFRACRVAIVGADFDEKGATPEHTEQLVEQLERWRDLFACAGKGKRAVNSTLTAFGEQASSYSLWGLRFVPLHKPVASLAHLEVLGALGAHPRAAHLHPQMELVEHTDETELKYVLSRVGPEVPGVSSRVVPEHALPELLASCDVVLPRKVPANFLWQVVELAQSATIDDNTSTALPPIPPPRVDGLRFLKTVGEIIREGEVMHHCVASRRFLAASGDAFLFHAGPPGDGATIQLDSKGNIVEARGRGNHHSSTVDWAVRVLSAWSYGWWAPALGLDRPVWRSPRMQAPPGSEPLYTVADCLREYQRGCEDIEDIDGRLASWYVDQVKRAERGDCFLVARAGSVVAIDNKGRALAHTSEVLGARMRAATFSSSA